MAPRAALFLVAMTTAAAAQPAGDPAPLAPVKDDQQIAATLSAITQDPAIPVADPATRALAQALMVEGVKQLDARAYDQALANFLEAYSKFPSPKILLNVASTLRDMGRLADAANTYQRYLLDPATGAERVGEVKQLLLALDDQLTILTVRVMPRGSDISIDGGPFIAVGSSLLTRVRPGLHLVRIRKDGASSEITVNGFEGENKEVVATLQAPVAASPPEVQQVPSPEVRPDQGGATSSAGPPLIEQAPERVDGWLITGTQYAAADARGRERKPRAGWSGPEVPSFIPSFELTDGDEPIAHDPAPSIGSGVIGVVRVDGEGRGFAGGLGLAISSGRFEADLILLKSDQIGAYVGLRYRLLQGWLRPYVGGGVPGFAYDHVSGDATSTRLAVGVRAAAGVELMINGHLSVQADLGYEHFFVEMDAQLDANIFVPSVGVIGRL